MACTIFALWMIGPKVETTYFPVVSKLEILSMTAGSEPGTTVITTAFDKFRTCDYLGLAWYRGKQDTVFERVSVVLQRKTGDTSSPNRPTGRQTSGPWIIGMPIEEIKQNSFAQLFHRCHPFWTTITEFYP